MTRVSLDDIIKTVDDLPTLPHIVLQIMELTENSETTTKQIAQVISQDQSMTAKVLRLANSAYYGLPRRIGTVNEAIVILGFATIRSLVFTVSMSRVLNRKLEGYALDAGELWKHSLGTAIAARWISRKVRYNAPEIAYTAGLLHDIGKVILNNFIKEAYIEVIEKVEYAKVSFIDAEEAILGFNHASAGGRAARKWRLPLEIVEAIEYHHNPSGAERDRVLTSLVHVADAICASLGMGTGVDGLLYPVSKKAMKVLKLKGNDVDNIISELADFYTDI